MRQITELPSVFERYRGIGGVLEFAVFDGSVGSEDEHLEAIRAVIPAPFGLDAALLRDVGSRTIGLTEFLGKWCNPANGRLIRVGKWYGPEDLEFDDPELVSLEGIPGEGGVYFPPDPGSGGQFAYAFQCPPGSLKAGPLEVQTLFDTIYAFLLPQGEEAEIRDWSSPELDAVSDWFASGVDGWGMFLFTIHCKGSGRLCAIAAASDY
ncbi:MAG: hypothetical protein AB7F98_17290 [Novosphingobium sp.]